MIQSDIAYYLYTGTRIFSLPSNKIKGICPLYLEAVHIVTKKGLGIRSVKDLKGRIVSVGQRNSGSEFNTRIILNTFDITYEDITPVYEFPDQSIDLLKKNRIDAFFVTTKVPALSLIKPFEELNLSLVPISTNDIEKVLKAYPFFISKRIDAYSYPNQKQEVSTIGVRALLIANAYMKSETVRQITETLFENKKNLLDEHPFVSLTIPKSTDIMPIPLHLGAKKYFIDIGIIEKPFLPFYFNIVIITTLVVFIFFILFKKFPTQINLLFKNFYVRYFLFFFSLVFLGTVGMHLSERGMNENFFNVSQSFWSCIVYIFSGFGDRAPITSFGKATSVFILGVTIFGVISGRFASYFVEKALKKEKAMPKNLNDHIVICNWNFKGEAIINELYNANPNLDITILSGTEIPNEKELQSRVEFKKVNFVHGDPALHDRINTCKIQSAKSVIILLSEISQDPDAQSALIALAISKVCREKRPHMIAEALNHRKIHHLQDAGVDEVICAVDYGTGLMAQSAIHPGLSRVYDRLLSYSEDTNEIYVIDKENVPFSFKNKRFFETSDILNKNQETKNPAILIGIMRDGETILNPKQGQDKIKENDSLLILAYTMPDLSQI